MNEDQLLAGVQELTDALNRIEDLCANAHAYTCDELAFDIVAEIQSARKA